MKATLGVIGMGVMGQNLARNLASRGFSVSIWNRTFATAQEVVKDHPEANFTMYEDIKHFIANLETPRKILLMVKAGNVVDKVYESLVPFLDKGDIVIDGGNSFFADSERRHEMAEKNGHHWVGLGVSGGEEGALKGPSLMPGASKTAYALVEKYLKAISAKDFNGGDCVVWLGQGGAGHAVKMIHNGIEYGIMQLMAEVFDLLRRTFGLNSTEIKAIFEKLNTGQDQSYLLDTAVLGLSRPDELAGEGMAIETIKDTAGQKGTGRWTVIEGIKNGVDVSVMAAAVRARVISSFKNDRVSLKKNLNNENKSTRTFSDEDFKAIQKALAFATKVSYLQGFMLLKELKTEHPSWTYSLPEVCRIWQGGCIVRSGILVPFAKNLEQIKDENLWKMDIMKEDLADNLRAVQHVLGLSTNSLTPMLAHGAVLDSVSLWHQSTSSADFIQMLRDGFGRHGFKRTDREGDYHLDRNHE